MYIFINELSFQAQAQNDQHANSLITNIISILRSLGSIQGNDPVRTSGTLWEREIIQGCSINSWLNKGILNRDQRIWFTAIVRKGPFIENILTETIDYHECWFQCEDVSSTSLAGAACFEGALASLQQCIKFDYEQICLNFREGEQDFKKVKILNFINPDTVQVIIGQINKEILDGISSWDQLWNQRTLLYGNLIFCECVQDQLYNLDFTPTNIKIIKHHLDKMNDYAGKLNNDDDIVPDYMQMGIKASKERDATIIHYGYQREFVCPDGVKRLFEWHSKQMGQNLRIHFYPPDLGNDQFIIGYIGPHLDT